MPLSPSPLARAKTLGYPEGVLLNDLETAAELEDAGRYQEAKAVLNRVWPRVGEEPAAEGLSKAAHARLLLRAGSLTGYIGSARQMAGAQEQAKDLITRAAAAFEQAGDADGLARARHALAVCYWREGAFDEARVMLACVADSGAAVEVTSKAVITRAVVERAAGRHYDALAVLEGGEGQIGRCDSPLLKAKFHNQRASCWQWLGQTSGREEFLARAEMDYVAACAYFDQAGHLPYKGRALNNLGLVYTLAGKHGAAHRELRRALSIFDKAGERGSAAQVHETRARVFLAEGKATEAESAAAAAVYILSQGDESALLAEALITQATALARLGRRDRALSQLRLAARVAERVGYAEGAGLARLTIVEELREVMPQAEMLEEFRAADRLLSASQDVPLLRRLRGCAGALLQGPGAEGGAEVTIGPGFSLDAAVHEYEGRLIEEAMRRTAGNVMRAAAMLGLPSYQNLQKKLKGPFKHLQFLTNKRRGRGGAAKPAGGGGAVIKGRFATPAPPAEAGLVRFRLAAGDDSLAGSGPRGGDTLVLLRCSVGVEGACVVLRCGAEAHAGFYGESAGRVTLRPDNHEFDPREFDAGEVRVVGWVLGFVREGEPGGLIYPLRPAGR